MKHLKMFKEGIFPKFSPGMQATKFPQYERGKIIVFSNSDLDLDTEFVEKIAKQLGCTCGGEQMENGFIINTPVGREEEIGNQFVEDYPEFFQNYERHDLNMENIYDECGHIVDAVETLRDSMGSINEFGKVLLPDEWNESIDEIIKRLSDLKHE